MNWIDSIVRSEVKAHEKVKLKPYGISLNKVLLTPNEGGVPLEEVKRQVGSHIKREFYLFNLVTPQRGRECDIFVMPTDGLHCGGPEKGKFPRLKIDDSVFAVGRSRAIPNGQKTRFLAKGFVCKLFHGYGMCIVGVVMHGGGMPIPGFGIVCPKWGVWFCQSLA
eukprot:Gb_15116 [translate_table: standard]